MAFRNQDLDARYTCYYLGVVLGPVMSPFLAYAPNPYHPVTAALHECLPCLTLINSVAEEGWERSRQTFMGSKFWLTLRRPGMFLHGSEPFVYTEVICPWVDAVWIQGGPYHTKQSTSMSSEIAERLFPESIPHLKTKVTWQYSQFLVIVLGA